MRTHRAFLVALFFPIVVAACSERAIVGPLTPPGPLFDGSCDPTTAIIPCGDETGSGAGTNSGIDIGYSWDSCLAPAQDSDGDGLDDGCEVALARAFAPGMFVHYGECGWDYGLDRVGGEYYYGIKRPVGTSGVIRIGYFPAYYKDCGYSGHTGDSEFILIDVRFQRNPAAYFKWHFQAAHLSSHCDAHIWGQPTDPDCQWWGAEYWDGGPGSYVDGVPRGAPNVWVASGKHGNYFSKAKCEDGGYWQDSCAGSYHFRRFPVVHRWQNIDFPESGAFSMIPPRWGSSLPNPNGRETFAETRCDQVTCVSFTGWMGYVSGSRAAPYGSIIRNYTGWWTTTYAPSPIECGEYDPATALYRNC